MYRKIAPFAEKNEKKMDNLFISKYKNIIICWILLILLSFSGWLLHPQLAQFLSDPATNGAGYDFFHYYASVKALQEGMANIYDPQLMKEYSSFLSEGRWAVFDNHPLPFYLLYIPFAQDNWANSYLKHTFWQFFFYAVGLLLLCCHCFADSKKKIAWLTWALLVVGSFSWGVWLDNFLLGQVGGLFFFSLAAVVVCTWKKQNFLCGLALSVAILLKLYPAVLLIWLLAKRRYKAVGYCLFTLATLALGAGLQWGFFRFGQYVQFLFTEQSYQEVASNQSLMTLINACLYDVSPLLIKLINVALLTVGAVFLWHNGSKVQSAKIASEPTSSRHTDSSNNFTLLALDYSTWILLMLMLSPLSWSHHHLALLIPFLVIIAALHNGSLPNASRLLWIALAIGCALFIVDSETLHGTIGSILYILFYMAFYYKLVLLLMAVWEVLLVWIVKKESR